MWFHHADMQSCWLLTMQACCCVPCMPCRPAPACQDTALLLGLDSTLQHLAATAVDLQVPLHAKYPQPYAAGYQGWRWTLTGVHGVLL
jgi:hypothetical protein